jgi:hypothetical protein
MTKRWLSMLLSRSRSSLQLQPVSDMIRRVSSLDVDDVEEGAAVDEGCRKKGAGLFTLRMRLVAWRL